jgi:hypothetical protein
MPTALLAALCGAAVAFAGTYLLQRAQFRHVDLDRLRERLGVARGLRADLLVSKLLCEVTLKNSKVPPGTSFPTDLWVSHGHLLMAAFYRPAEACMIDAFGRMGLVNRIFAAPPFANQAMDLRSSDGAQEDLDLTATLHLMIEKFDAAVSVLDAYEVECEQRSRRLLHPLISRIRGAASGAPR